MLFRLIIGFFLLFAVGCNSAQTYSKSYKTLKGSQVTVTTLYQTVVNLHASGQVTEAQFTKAGEVYDAVKRVQKEFIEAQIVAIDTKNQSTNNQAAALGVAYLIGVSNFINLAIEYGVIAGDDPSIQAI